MKLFISADIEGCAGVALARLIRMKLHTVNLQSR